MCENILHLSDSLSSKEVKHILDNAHGRSFRTEILAGYTDSFYRDARGRSQLGEQVIKPQKNKIVLGGMVYFLQQAFGVEPHLYSVPTINEMYNIGTEPYDEVVESSKICLFNVGLGGCGSSYADVNMVLDQQNVIDNMIPFRVVNEGANVSTINGGGPYWLKKTNTTTVNNVSLTKDWYYMKQFDTDSDTGEANVRIFSFWRDDEIGKDGTDVTNESLDKGNSRTEGIETCAEIIMSITPTDLREYFEIYQDSSQARFNSIGLCSGTKCMFADGSYEYTNVRQNTVLNFSNEMLHFEKGLTIIYRIYLS